MCQEVSDGVVAMDDTTSMGACKGVESQGVEWLTAGDASRGAMCAGMGNGRGCALEGGRWGGGNKGRPSRNASANWKVLLGRW